MNVTNLECLLENVPGDFDVLVKYGDSEIIMDNIEIDVKNKKIILK